jgi:hypothetical protein
MFNIQTYSLLTWPLSPILHISLFSFPNYPFQNFTLALIMLRVVLGSARPDTEWSGRLSGL